MRFLASPKTRGFKDDSEHFLFPGGAKIRLQASRKPHRFMADPAYFLRPEVPKMRLNGSRKPVVLRATKRVSTSWRAENATSRK